MLAFVVVTGRERRGKGREAANTTPQNGANNNNYRERSESRKVSKDANKRRVN